MGDAKAKTEAKSGGSKIVIDQARLLDLLDRTSNGAASSFVRTVTGELEARKDEAIKVWPVRSGESKRSFVIETAITKTELKVSIANTASHKEWGFYAFKIRNSVRTRASLQAEAREYAARGGDSAARGNIYEWRLRQLRRTHGMGARTPEEAGKRSWSVYVQKPVEKRRLSVVKELRAELEALAVPAPGGE